MLTWWKNSPYYDTNVYLPGSANRGVDPNLNKDWVKEVRGYGWGLIPIWFGLQSPCVVNKKITKYFSSVPAQANTQGIAEADAAVASANSLGITATIIYKDIEPFGTAVSSSCDAAVIAFLGGWTQEIHQKLGVSTAGVYGSPSAAQADFTQAQPPPDDVWISQWNQQRTIWHLTGLSDSNWPVDQRIHQYMGSASCQYTETWGGLNLCIDPDIEDATIVNNTGSKTYSYAYGNIDYPGGNNCTMVFGLNNVSNSGFLPAIAGSVWQNDGDSDCNGDVGAGGPTSTFVEWQGQYMIIPGTTAQGQYSYLAEAVSINDAGQTLGWFYGNSGSPTNFIASPPFSGFTALGCAPVPMGINDAGQIVSQTGSGGSPTSFLQDSATSKCVGLPTSLLWVTVSMGRPNSLGTTTTPT
jgi:hypothetical protein